MTPDYSALAQLLQQRLDVISDTQLREKNPEQQLHALQTVSENIAAWHLENRASLPSQLNHFLQQCSLSKALDFLHTEGLV